MVQPHSSKIASIAAVARSCRCAAETICFAFHVTHPQSLLLLAWKRLQDTDPSDPESNYQLSGIHGAPYVAFNGSYGAATGGVGYCWHSSVLFPTWHR